MNRNQALLAWFQTDGRDLPWRGETDPWRILVVEVMSQQTQVARVMDSYGSFLERFPTPGDLAGARPEEAVRLWAGLGYLRRLHHLRAAAAQIALDGWPENLTDLPGVGPYTAAAVSCFSTGAVMAAVDTNHRRVISRWQGEPLRGRGLDGAAARLIDVEDPAGWNQAVMDLGATICRRDPECHRCPVERWCADPTVYVRPPAQSRYRGSVREARALILKLLADGPNGSAEVEAHGGHHTATALAALQAEGMVEASNGQWRLR